MSFTTWKLHDLRASAPTDIAVDTPTLLSTYTLRGGAKILTQGPTPVYAPATLPLDLQAIPFSSKPETPSSLSAPFEGLRQIHAAIDMTLDAGTRDALFQDFRPRFITFRNNLNKIASIADPQQRDDFRIMVGRARGCLFLDIVKNDEDRNPKHSYSAPSSSSSSSSTSADVNSTATPFEHYGRAFEESMRRWEGQPTAEPFDEYNGVFAVKLNGLAGLVVAELDARDGKSMDGGKQERSAQSQAISLAASGEADFVEFKCFTQPNSDREKWVAENVKLRKAWVQSFLVGVPRIVVGWRNSSTGVVERMEEIRTVDIPGREGVEWSAQETLSIVVRVLENLLQLTAEGQFYMVTWHAADKSMTVKQQPVSTTVLFSFTKLFK